MATFSLGGPHNKQFWGQYLVSFHDEAHGWELAATVADQHLSQAAREHLQQNIKYSNTKTNQNCVEYKEFNEN